MADLSPDTSIYAPFARQGQPLDLNTLMGLVARFRQLNTQAAISGALRANPDDPLGAVQRATQTPGAFVGPEDIASGANSAAALTHLGATYNEQIGKAAGALYAKAISKQGANANDWHQFQTIASSLKMPGELLARAGASVVRPDGKLDPTALANWYNIVSGGQQLPQQQYQTPTGRIETAPAATFTTGGPAGGGAGGSPGTATISTPAGALVGAGAGADYRTDTTAARNFQSDVTPLRHMIAGLENGTITGRGTEEVNNLRNFLHAMNIDSLFGKDLSKETVPYEELKKYMIKSADLASAGGTNDRLAAAVSGNPNAKLLSLTNLQLAKVNLALRRLQQVGYQEFQKQIASGASFNGKPLQYEDYSNWYTQWAAQQDSRAFVHDLMSKDQRESMFKNMKSKDELDAYRASWNAMHANHPEIERAGAP